jgi:UDP-N-acetylglucosamine 2-epimerase (non-hydrolysing)
LLGAIDAIAKEIPVIFPVHPRTQSASRKPESHTIQIFASSPPVGYLDFLCLLSKATLVLTDSGGIPEETTALGVPCLTLRQKTERPITISEGTNLLIGADPARIVAAAQDVLAGKGEAGRIPPLWDGHASERIVEILLGTLSRGKRALGVT